MHLPRTRGIGIAVTVLLSLAGARAWAGIERTDPQREIELGRQVAREIERRYPLSTDPSLQRRVDRIGKALTAPINPKVYPYEFKVLGTRDINAVSLPGGYIYIFEGLMAAMPNDNALAFVMGHELAHASCRHWATHTNKIEGLRFWSPSEASSPAMTSAPRSPRWQPSCSRSTTRASRKTRRTKRALCMPGRAGSILPDVWKQWG